MLPAALGAMPTQASPTKIISPAISKIVVTQYTCGKDSDPSSNPKPIYRISLSRDSNALYVGSKTYMKRIGRYHGMVQSGDFLKLADLFEKNSFRKWRGSYNDYNGRLVAFETYEITFGTQKKTIVSYELSGPPALRQASKISYGLLWKIHWQKISESDAFSG